MGGAERDEGRVDNRSVDEKLAPHDFVADFVWAGREVLRKPGVAVVSVLYWSGSAVFTPLMARQAKNPLALLVGAIVAMTISFFWMGWLGAERTFFRLRLEGKEVTLRHLLGGSPVFIGRFFALGLLAGMMAVPATGVAAGVAAALTASSIEALALRATVVNVIVVLVTVLVDFAFTFVTPALVFTTSSATKAIGIGFRMIRQTWPRSGLYVLCPPLALNMLNVMFPIRLPLVTLVSTAAFAVLALVAKGATAAFYLREHPIVSNDRSVVAGVE